MNLPSIDVTSVITHRDNNGGYFHAKTFIYVCISVKLLTDEEEDIACDYIALFNRR